MLVVIVAQELHNELSIYFRTHLTYTFATKNTHRIHIAIIITSKTKHLGSKS